MLIISLFSLYILCNTITTHTMEEDDIPLTTPQVQEALGNLATPTLEIVSNAISVSPESEAELLKLSLKISETKSLKEINIERICGKDTSDEKIYDIWHSHNKDIPLIFVWRFIVYKNINGLKALQSGINKQTQKAFLWISLVNGTAIYDELRANYHSYKKFLTSTIYWWDHCTLPTIGNLPNQQAPGQQSETSNNNVQQISKKRSLEPVDILKETVEPQAKKRAVSTNTTPTSNQVMLTPQVHPLTNNNNTPNPVCKKTIQTTETFFFNDGRPPYIKNKFITFNYDALKVPILIHTSDLNHNLNSITIDNFKIKNPENEKPFWEDYTLMPCNSSAHVFMEETPCDNILSQKRIDSIQTSAHSLNINRICVYKNDILNIKNYQIWFGSTNRQVTIYDFKTHAKKDGFFVEEVDDFIEGYRTIIHSSLANKIDDWQTLSEAKSWYEALKGRIQNYISKQ